MTTTARGRHRKLRRNILHTVVATALLAGTFTVVDQTVSSQLSAASANEAGKVDGTFTSTARAAQSIAAFSDSSFVVGYSIFNSDDKEQNGVALNISGYH
jgi:hypothetical protein